MQDNVFKPSETNELRTLIQSISIQILDLDDTIFMNESCATKPFHREDSNNTTVLQNAQNAEPINIPHFPVSQIASAIEKFAKCNSQPSFVHPKNTLTFDGNLEKNEKFEFFEDLFHTTFRMQPYLT